MARIKSSSIHRFLMGEKCFFLQLNPSKTQRINFVDFSLLMLLLLLLLTFFIYIFICLFCWCVHEWIWLPLCAYSTLHSHVFLMDVCHFFSFVRLIRVCWCCLIVFIYFLVLLMCFAQFQYFQEEKRAEPKIRLRLRSDSFYIGIFNLLLLTLSLSRCHQYERMHDTTNITTAPYSRTENTVTNDSL